MLCGTRTVSWDVFVRGMASLDLGRASWMWLLRWQPADKAITAVPGVRHHLHLVLSLVSLWSSIPRPTNWHHHQCRATLHGETTSMRNYLARFYSRLRMSPTIAVPLVVCRAFIWLVMSLPLAVPVIVFVPDTRTASFSPPNTRPSGFPGWPQNMQAFTLVVGVFGLIWLAIAMMVTFTFTSKILSPDKGALELDMSQEGIIRALRDRLATDPKDKSYSMYGVLQCLMPTDPSPPSYDKPRGVIYQELLMDLIAWNPRFIRLLSGAGINKLPNTPSWVPDWSATPQDPWLQRLDEQDADVRIVEEPNFIVGAIYSLLGRLF